MKELKVIITKEDKKELVEVYNNRYDEIKAEGNKEYLEWFEDGIGKDYTNLLNILEPLDQETILTIDDYTLCRNYLWLLKTNISKKFRKVFNYFHSYTISMPNPKYKLSKVEKIIYDILNKTCNEFRFYETSIWAVPNIKQCQSIIKELTEIMNKPEYFDLSSNIYLTRLQAYKIYKRLDKDNRA